MIVIVTTICLAIITIITLLVDERDTDWVWATVLMWAVALIVTSILQGNISPPSTEEIVLEKYRIQQSTSLEKQCMEIGGAYRVQIYKIDGYDRFHKACERPQ